MKLNPSLIPRLDVEFGLDDLLLSFRDGPDAHRGLASELRSLWPESQALFLDSGRSSLYVGLRALGLRNGSRVGVPLYTCEAVFEAIVRAGCRPEFLDVDPATYTVDPGAAGEAAQRLDALVAIHTFGHPADLDSLRQAVGDVPIIEDCAHAVGTRYKGRPAGGLSDLSFFSFRLGKPLSVGNLGMLLCNDTEIFERAREIVDGFPGYTSARHAFSALQAFGRATFYKRPWFGLVSLPLGSAIDERLDLMEKRGFDLHRASAGTLAVLAARLKEVSGRVEKSRRAAEILCGSLPPAVTPPIEAPWAFHSFFQFAIRFKDANARQHAADRLAECGVDSIRFYEDSPVFARRYGYILGSCRSAEAVAETVLTVPCHSHLGDEDLHQIAESLASLEAAR